MASVRTSYTLTTIPSKVSSLHKQAVVTKTYTRSIKPKEGLGLYDSEGEIPVEYEKACRLCLNETDMMVNIFNDQENLLIADKIRSLLELEIKEDDELPSLICSTCLHQLDEACDFKKRCVYTDYKLRQFLVKEPQRSSEPSSSSLIDLIDNFSPVLTKQECTLEWNDFNPLATLYESQPRSPKSSTYDCAHSYKQQKATNNKSPAPTMTKLTAVPANHMANGLNESESDLEIFSEDEVVDDPLPIKRNESLDVQCHRDIKSPSPTKAVRTAEEDPLHIGNETTPTLKSIGLVKAFTSKTSVVPRFRSKQPSRPEVKDTDNNEIVQLDKDNLPLKDRLILEIENRNREINRCHRCNDVLLIPLKEHIQDCGAAPRCSVCDKAFYNPSLLKRHYRIHTGEKPFECSHCDRAFSQKESLHRHFFSQHGKKTFICPLCDKAFATKSLLAIHITNVHDRKRKELIFKCNQCDKTFLHSSGLSRHQNFHKGTLFHCKICTRQFTDQSAITRHLKKAHLTTYL